MILLLRVEPPAAADKTALPSDGLIEVDRTFTIGRSPENDLVLDDPTSTISKRHCTISPDDGGFVLSDQSRNGTLVRRDGRGLRRDSPVLLQSDDVIQVGGYTLFVVSAVARAGHVAAEDDQSSDEPSFLGAVAPTPHPDAQLAHFDLAGRVDDRGSIIDDAALQPFPDGFLDEAPGAERRDGTSPTTRGDHVAVPNMAFVQPRLRTEPIPDGWDLMEELHRPAVAPLAPPMPAALHDEVHALLDDEAHAVLRDEVRIGPGPEPGPTAAPASDPVGSSEDAEAVEAFLDACGFTTAERAHIDRVAMMRRAGGMLRLSIDNLHTILEARTLTKESFGVERTMLGRSGNNPLKFVADPHDALVAVLLATIPGFIVADEAVEQAFTDIKDYQIAMVAAMQDALAKIFRQLRPESIERAVGPPRLLDHLTFRRDRRWQAYMRVFDETLANIDHDARQIFGVGFARHYEDKMASFGLRPVSSERRVPPVDPPERDMRTSPSKPQRA